MFSLFYLAPTLKFNVVVASGVRSCCHFFVTVGLYSARVCWFRLHLACGLFVTPLGLFPWPVTVVRSRDFNCCWNVIAIVVGFGKLCAHVPVGDSLLKKLLDILIIGNLLSVVFKMQHGCFCTRIYIILRVSCIDILY